MGLLKKGTVLPQSAGGNFIRLPKDGEAIRVKLLSPQTECWEYWLEDKTCLRVPEKLETLPRNMRLGDNGKPEAPKFCWMFVAYEITSKTVGVLQVAQKSIIEAIYAIDEDEDYDLETNYALKISRTGATKNNTKYSVGCLLIKPELQPSAEALEEAAGIDLKAVAFGNGDDAKPTPKGGVMPPDADEVLAAIM